MKTSRINPIQAVSFDVGGTLIDPWPSVGHVYAEVAAAMDLPLVDPLTLNKQFAAAWKVQKNFGYSRAEWASLVVSACDLPASRIGLDTPFFNRLYDRFTEASAWHIYEDVRPTLEQLRARGLKLAVLSNWDERLRLVLQNLNLEHSFDLITVSAEIGYHKPAPEIFAHLLAGLNVAAASVLHVGDLRYEDFEGASAAGLQSVWLRRGQPPATTDEIASLTELLDRVETFNCGV